MDITNTAPLEIRSQIALPLYLHSVQAGYDSPVDEDEPAIDLNELLIRQEQHCFIARASGDDLRQHDINDGDLLLVNRRLKPSHGDLVIAAVDEELLCREIDLRNSQLISDDESQPQLSLTDRADLRIEGVVTGVIRQLK